MVDSRRAYGYVCEETGELPTAAEERRDAANTKSCTRVNRLQVEEHNAARPQRCEKTHWDIITGQRSICTLHIR